MISLVKELGTGGGGGEGGNGGEDGGEDGGEGSNGGENGGENGGLGPGGGGEEEWPPIGWEDPPGIYPPLTPHNPIVRLEEEDAPPVGAVWPHLPVKKGRYAALVEAGEHGYFVVSLDASVQWPEAEDEDGDAGGGEGEHAGRRR